MRKFQHDFLHTFNPETAGGKACGFSKKTSSKKKVKPCFFVTVNIRGYYEIGVHFFEKIKGIVKKGNCTNNFQYRLNF